MIRLVSLLALLLLLHNAASLQLGSIHEMKHDFCWKDSYGRGVGSIPNQCAPGYQKIGLLCYQPCQSGFSRKVFDCHQNCPQGFADQGLFCRRSQYGRGAGYWTQKKCEANEGGKGSCEKYGLLQYPKCKPGYTNFGCCICRPARPDCNALGMNGQIDLSCAKKIQLGKPHFATCPADLQYSLFLCHPSCRKGYYGVGPVCWMETPKQWSGCGMGAARSTAVCVSTIIGEVASVAQLAFNIVSAVVTLGGSAAAIQSKNAAQAATMLPSLKTDFQIMMTAFKKSKQIDKIVSQITQIKNTGQVTPANQQAVDAVGVVKQVKNLDVSKVTAADIVRISAQIAALADPTGIAKVVQSFSYPKCTDIIDQINVSNQPKPPTRPPKPPTRPPKPPIKTDGPRNGRYDSDPRRGHPTPIDSSGRPKPTPTPIDRSGRTKPNPIPKDGPSLPKLDRQKPIPYDGPSQSKPIQKHPKPDPNKPIHKPHPIPKDGNPKPHPIPKDGHPKPGPSKPIHKPHPIPKDGLPKPGPNKPSHKPHPTIQIDSPRQNKPTQSHPQPPVSTQVKDPLPIKKHHGKRPIEANDGHPPKSNKKPRQTSLVPLGHIEKNAEKTNSQLNDPKAPLQVKSSAKVDLPKLLKKPKQQKIPNDSTAETKKRIETQSQSQQQVEDQQVGGQIGEILRNSIDDSSISRVYIIRFNRQGEDQSQGQSEVQDSKVIHKDGNKAKVVGDLL